MADTEKTVLIKADIVSNFVEAKKNVDEIRRSYKELQNRLIEVQKTQGKESEEYKQLNAEISEQAKLLANANVKFREATKIIEGAARSQDLINSATQNADNSLRALERDLNALRNIDLSKVSKEELPKISAAIAETSKKIQAARLQIEELNTSTSKSLARIAEGFQFLSASVTGIKGLFGSLGIESESLEKLNSSIVTLIGVTQALGVVSEYLSKQKYKLFLVSVKNIAISIKNAVALAAEKVAALGTAAATLIMGKAANTASLGFKALRVALISTGIGALIVGVGLLIANLDKLFSLFKSKPDKDLVASFNKMSQAYDKAQKDNERYIQSLKDKGKAESEVLNETFKLQQKALDDAAVLQYKAQAINDKEYKKAIERTKEAQKALRETADGMIGILDKITGAVETANLKKSMSDAEYTKHVIKQNAEQQRSHVALLQLIRRITAEQAQAYREAINQNEQNELAEAEKKAAETAKKAVEDKRKATEKANKDALDAAKKQIDSTLELEKSKLEAGADFNKKDFAAAQAHARQMFDLEHKAAEDRLKLELQYGAITQAEYDRQNSLLVDEQKKFGSEQLQAATEKIKSLQKQTSKLIKEQTDMEIADYRTANKMVIDDLKKQAAELEKEIEKSSSKQGKGGGTGAPDPELEKQYKETQAKIAALKTQEQDAINEITKKGLEEQKALINKNLDEMYSDRFEAAKNNEIKTLELEREMLEKRIAERKKAGITDNAADEAALNATKIKTVQANAQLELLATAKTEKEKYDIKRKALEDTLKLYEANTLEYANTLNAIKQLDADFQASQMEKWAEYADYAMQAFSSIRDIIANMDDARITEAEENNNREKENLKAMLDANLISETEYNRKVKQSDENLAKEKAKIARKQAIMEKAMAVAQIGINTALAIMKIWADVPKADFGASTIALTAIVAALGALQLAAVASQPIPQAARGRVIGGQSHAAGGTLIEAEKGEAIINKKSVGLFPELLSLVNQLGGGVPFTRPYSDGGFAVREYRRNQSATVDADAIAEAVTTAVKNVQIYTAIEDIRKEDYRYAEMTEQGSIFN